MKHLRFATSLLLSSLSATPLMTAETSADLNETASPSWLANSKDGAALHRVSYAVNGLGEAYSAASILGNELNPWQQAMSYQNSLLQSSPLLAGSELASVPASFIPSVNALASTAFLAPHTQADAQAEARLHSSTPMRLSEFETAAISQPDIYTMLLIGLGLLSLRSRPRQAQEEKFSA